MNYWTMHSLLLIKFFFFPLFLFIYLSIKLHVCFLFNVSNSCLSSCIVFPFHCDSCCTKDWKRRLKVWWRKVKLVMIYLSLKRIVQSSKSGKTSLAATTLQLFRSLHNTTTIICSTLSFTSLKLESFQTGVATKLKRHGHHG